MANLMFTKLQRRMIKEGIIAVYRNFPETARYPVYYLTTDNRSPEEIGSIISGLHELPQIPWPAQDCICICEDHLVPLLSPESTMKGIAFLVHSSTDFSRFNRIPKSESVSMVEPVRTIKVMYLPEDKGQIVVEISAPVTLTHINEHFVVTGIDEYVDHLFGLLTRRAAASLQIGISSPNPEMKQIFRQYLAASLPRGDSHWVCEVLGDRNRNPWAAIWFASDILGYLATIAVPCNYVVKSKFKEGFGTPAMQRLTRGMDIFTVINYDRLYRELNLGEHDAHQIAPHKRRGHIRYHWKKAGLNRHYLPASAAERIKLVHKRRVPRSYIPPMWVGKRDFDEKDVLHKILSDDIPLAAL